VEGRPRVLAPRVGATHKPPWDAGTVGGASRGSGAGANSQRRHRQAGRPTAGPVEREGLAGDSAAYERRDRQSELRARKSRAQVPGPTRWARVIDWGRDRRPRPAGPGRGARYLGRRRQPDPTPSMRPSAGNRAPGPVGRAMEGQGGPGPAGWRTRRRQAAWPQGLSGAQPERSLPRTCKALAGPRKPWSQAQLRGGDAGRVGEVEPSGTRSMPTRPTSHPRSRAVR